MPNRWWNECNESLARISYFDLVFMKQNWLFFVLLEIIPAPLDLASRFRHQTDLFCHSFFSTVQWLQSSIKIKWVIWREPPAHCMARLRLSRLSVDTTGAARQLFCVGGSTVDSASPSREFCWLGFRAGICVQRLNDQKRSMLVLCKVTSNRRATR